VHLEHRLILRDLLTTQARRFEKRIFLEYDSKEVYSYGAVDDRTDRVATGLSRLGLRFGDRVALLLTNRPEFVFFLLGAPKVGMVPVPIDPSWKEDEIRFAIRHSGAAAIVTENALTDLCARVSDLPRCIVVDDLAFAGAPFQNLSGGTVLGFWPDLSPADPAALLYAPGKNPVALSNQNLVSNCVRMLQPFRIDESDRFLCELPLSSITAAVILLLAPWAAGATCVLRGAFSPRLVGEIEENGITVLAGTPALYRRIVESPRFSSANLSSLRLALCTAGSAGERTSAEFEERHDALIVEAYGSLETSGLCCANPYTGIRKPGSVGLPLPGQECRIVTRKGEEFAPGIFGEILVRGPNVMKGYYGNEEATTRALRDGWLHTGDEGYIDSDGYYFLGCPPASITR
jgi:long-chain acyl-CoA synthetase